MSDDVLDDKYLIGTLNRNIDYELDLYKTVNVAVTFDWEEGLILVA